MSTALVRLFHSVTSLLLFVYSTILVDGISYLCILPHCHKMAAIALNNTKVVSGRESGSGTLFLLIKGKAFPRSLPEDFFFSISAAKIETRDDTYLERRMRNQQMFSFFLTSLGQNGQGDRNGCTLSNQ